MKYLAAYAVNYAIALVLWLFLGAPAGYAVGLSHLCGLLTVFIWRLHEISVARKGEG